MAIEGNVIYWKWQIRREIKSKGICKSLPLIKKLLGLYLWNLLFTLQKTLNCICLLISLGARIRLLLVSGHFFMILNNLFVGEGSFWLPICGEEGYILIWLFLVYLMGIKWILTNLSWLLDVVMNFLLLPHIVISF